MEKMKALVVHGISDVKLEEVDIPTIDEKQVLVKVKACGICGSDLPRVLDGQAHYFPIILGHEFAGEIVKIGSEVKGWSLGDRVTAAPLLPCSICNYCTMGKPHMCTSYSFIGSRENGAMAEYVAVNQQNLIKLPEEVSYTQGTLIEPITVAIHGVDRVNLRLGETVLVLGLGTIGLLTIQCLKAAGVGKIYAIDIVNEKLKIAKQLGADVAINSLEVDLKEYFAKNEQPTAVFETSGSAIGQAQSLSVVDKLGKVVYIGTSTKNVILTPSEFEKILRGELEVTGSWMSYSAPFPGYEWDTAVRLIKEKKIDVSPIITHKFRLEDRLKAFEILRDKNSNAIKVIFTID